MRTPRIKSSRDSLENMCVCLVVEDTIRCLLMPNLTHIVLEKNEKMNGIM